MSDKLEELQALLKVSHNQLRQAESKLDTLQDQAADAISAVEEQKQEVEEMREKVQDIEDEILRLL